MYLWNKIKEVRIEKCISIVELAECVDVTEAYIINLENGKIQNPSFFKMMRITKILDLDIYEIEDLIVDPEWLKLIKEAKALGLSETEVRNFIYQQKYMNKAK